MASATVAQGRGVTVGADTNNQQQDAAMATNSNFNNNNNNDHNNNNLYVDGASGEPLSSSLSSSNTSSNEGGRRGENATEAGTLRFLWAARRMDGQAVAVIPTASRAENGDEHEESSGVDGGSDELIMFALLHHLKALRSDGLTGVHTPTLHGPVRTAGAEWGGGEVP